MPIGTVKINSIYSVTIGGNDVGNLSAAFANWAAADTDGELFKALENYLSATTEKLTGLESALAESEAAKVKSDMQMGETLRSVLKESSEKDAAIEALNTEVNALKTIIAAKEAEEKRLMAPDIAAILPDLLEAGLEAWGEAAITAADPEKGVFPLVRQLEKTAEEPRSGDQCDRIKQLFGTIIHLSGVAPTKEQAIAMQEILTKGPLTTGPIGPEYLNFHPWIGVD